MVEVRQLHVRVVSHPHLENLPRVQLRDTRPQCQPQRDVSQQYRTPLTLTHLDVHDHPGRELLWDGDAVALSTRQAQAVGRVSLEELQRDHPHPHQVAAVDPLVTLRYDGLDALRRDRKPPACVLSFDIMSQDAGKDLQVFWTRSGSAV